MFDLGPRSNGEYLPFEPTPVVREAVRRLLAHADEHAPRHGLSRRRFLQTLCGAATTLVVLAACDNEESASRGEEPGGTFDVSTTATTDPDVAAEELTGDEFVFDVQTHLLDFELSDARGQQFGNGFPYADCGEADWQDCFGVDHWLEELFVRSDTTMAVVSAVPILAARNPLSIEVMEAAREAAERCVVDPAGCSCTGRSTRTSVMRKPRSMACAVSRPSIRSRRGRCTRTCRTNGAGSSTTTTPTVSSAVRRSSTSCAKWGRRSCVCTRVWATTAVGPHPIDIGAAAAANPDIRFVVYHSGYEGAEGPYTEATADTGINRLLAATEAAGIGPAQNVYAELGTTWWNAMRDPTQAAHVLGKLLARFGPERVCWGTDSIWYGSPQDQIQAFRTFAISEQFQEQYGYPALTDDTKRKVFGLNAAQLYGVEPETTACRADTAALDEYRSALPPKRSYGPQTYEEARTVMRAHGMRV